MLVPKLKKMQIVVMDNASIHKRKEIREAIEKAGCHLVFHFVICDSASVFS
jgi:transposase